MSGGIESKKQHELRTIKTPPIDIREANKRAAVYMARSNTQNRLPNKNRHSGQIRPECLFK